MLYFGITLDEPSMLQHKGMIGEAISPLLLHVRPGVAHLGLEGVDKSVWAPCAAVGRL